MRAIRLHDPALIVRAAKLPPLIIGLGDMETQMREAYANVQKVLAQYGATMANLVDEVLFVTDMEMVFAAAFKCRLLIFSGTPVVASTIVQIQRLASLS